MKTNMNENVRLRMECLRLISSIATKGANCPDPDGSRCSMRLLAYGISRYNYNNPDMGSARAHKELDDLKKMHWWLNHTDSEERGAEAQPLERNVPASSAHGLDQPRPDVINSEEPTSL